MTTHHPTSSASDAGEAAAGAASFLIADDHPVVTFALRALIESQTGWRVVGCVECPDKLPEAIERLHPTVVVMDLLFPSECGLEWVRTLERKYPQVRTVVYSVQPSSMYGPMCIEAGAEAYIRKDRPIEDIVRGLRSVLAGERWVDGEPWRPARRQSSRSNVLGLSAREIEVLQLLAQGMTSREIAAVLCRSIKTVETHRHRVARKLGARSSADLMRLAIRHAEATGQEAAALREAAAATHRTGDTLATPTHDRGTP